MLAPVACPGGADAIASRHYAPFTVSCGSRKGQFLKCGCWTAQSAIVYRYYTAICAKCGLKSIINRTLSLVSAFSLPITWIWCIESDDSYFSRYLRFLKATWLRRALSLLCYSFTHDSTPLSVDATPPTPERGQKSETKIRSESEKKIWNRKPKTWKCIKIRYESEDFKYQK